VNITKGEEHQDIRKVFALLVEKGRIAFVWDLHVSVQNEHKIV